MQDTPCNRIYAPDIGKNRKIFQLSSGQNRNVYYAGVGVAQSPRGLARGAAGGEYVIDEQDGSAL